MYGFCRLGLSPRPSSGATWVANGLATATTRKAKKSAIAPEHRHDPGDEVAGAAPVQEHGRGRVAGQDQQPQQQRALLTAPEGRDRVAGRQLAARVRRGVDEGEVVADERGEEHARGDERGGEGRDQRVLGGDREPAAARVRGVGTRDDGVEGQPERDDERGAAELRHGRYVSGAYFDGHFVISESRSATKTPFWSRPSTTMSRPGRNWFGDGARVEHRHPLRLAALDVAHLEAHPRAVRVPRGNADDVACERHPARAAVELARLHHRRAAARDRRVEQEHRERRGDGERDHETRTGCASWPLRGDGTEARRLARAPLRGARERGSRDPGRATRVRPR